MPPEPQNQIPEENFVIPSIDSEKNLPSPETVAEQNGSNGNKGENGMEIQVESTAQPVEPFAEEPAPQPSPEQAMAGDAEPETSNPDTPVEPELTAESTSVPTEPIPTPASDQSSSNSSSSASSQPSPEVTARQAGVTRQELLKMARASIQSRKKKKLDKIMEFLSTRETVTNDEVEKLLHVSDATATRYLEQLEKEGKIKQSGRTGQSVSYSRI